MENLENATNRDMTRISYEFPAKNVGVAAAEMSPTTTKGDIAADEQAPGESQGSELKPAQWHALYALAAGKTVLRAAEIGGVSQRTVFRWLREDAAFKAEYARLRSEQQLQTEASLDLLAHAAARCVERALQDGNARVALGVLKGLGYLSGRTIKSGAATAAPRGDSRELMVLLGRIAGDVASASSSAS